MALAMLALAGPAAAATTVSLDGAGDLDVATDDIQHVIVVTKLGADYRVSDTGPSATVSAGSGCTLDGAVAVCPIAGVTRLDIDGNNQNDSITIDAAITIDSDVHGGNGSDTLNGGGGVDHLFGDQHGDTISGGAGDDELTGTPWDDTIRGGAGADTISGGNGNDTTDYSERAAAVVVSLDGVVNDGQPGEGDVLGGIESIAGGDGDDTLTGDGGFNTLRGNGGNDDLVGLATSDQLYGGDGADTLDGGSSDDTLDGGAGDDDLLGGDQNDRLRGGPGSDDLTGGDGTDVADFTDHSADLTITLNGSADDGDAAANGGAGEDDNVATENVESGPGDDHITGDAQANVFSGSFGDDEMYGGDGNDTLNDQYDANDADQIYLGNGNDSSFAGSGADFVDGGPGDDSISGYHGNDELHGGDGNDSLNGGEDSDSLYGGDGDDSLTSWARAFNTAAPQTFDGGPGSDYADLQGEWLCCGSSGVSVTLDGVANDQTPYSSTDNYMNVETLQLTAGDDTLTGTNGPEVVRAGDGNNVVNAMGGDDYLVASYSAGNNVFNGGDGIDTADWSATPGPCSLTLDGAANDGRNSAPGGDMQVENLFGCGGDGSTPVSVVTGDDKPNMLRGGNGADTISGGGENDLLVGNDQNDTLNGGDGDDDLRGGNQSDTLNGDAGDDLLWGGPHGDVVVGGAGEHDAADYRDYLSAVSVSLDGSANDGSAGENDNVQTDDVLGGPEADTITGDGAANRLEGGGKDDQIRGGDGDDTLVGNSGNDLLDGQGGHDSADYSGGAAVNVTLDGAANDGITGEQDNVQAESVIGSDFADVLTGGAGADDLLGNEGADLISGGAGDDLLVGGAGTDAVTTGSGSDAVRIRDGEADSVVCDSMTGKGFEVDAALDTTSSCDFSQGVVKPGGGMGGANVPEFRFGELPAGIVVASGPRARSAAQLAEDLDLRRNGSRISVGRAGAEIDLGSFSCRAGMSCTVKVSLGTFGKGSAKVGNERTAIVARLSKAGWRALQKRRSAKVTATIRVSEGRSKATVRRSLVLRKSRGR